MSEGDSAVPALKVERRAWGQREFLERLISEHFVLITESEGGISWRVDAIDSDVATALSALSERLEPLGWLPLLEEEEPYILEITQFPVRPVTISKQMHVILWISSMIFLTLIGSSWAVRVNPDSTVLTGSSLASGFILYALPMMGTVALASILRRAVASAHGVRVDHLLPLSLPFTITGLNPIWPFGLVGLLHLRRVDQILFPDRGVLARVSIVVPATLIVSGIIFSILGLRATSGIPPEFTEMPFVLDLNWLVEITGTLLGYDVTSRSQWAYGKKQARNHMRPRQLSAIVPHLYHSSFFIFLPMHTVCMPGRPRFCRRDPEVIHLIIPMLCNAKYLLIRLSH